MFPVSSEFQEKILIDKRKVYGRVQIDYTDPFLDQSIIAEVNEQANVSYPLQTANSSLSPFGKIASLDGSWVLDGSYSIVNKDNEMGWWGEQLSNDNNYFNEPYPILTVNFNSRPIHTLRVIGDSLRKEYPVDFNIRMYNIDSELLHEEVITGNTKVDWSKAVDTVTQVSRMELMITRWNMPNRQVKILEFFTSIQEIYEGDDILSLSLLEERNSGNGSIPIGNISSNEITLTLNNKTRKFDAGNTKSPLYEMLKPNRRIKAWLGIKNDNEEKELVPLGTFWSGDWDVPEDNLYVKTVGTDRFKFLNESDYNNTDFKVNLSLYDLATEILEDAGLDQEEYWIDEELKDYIIPFAKLDSQSHREALRKVTNACLGQTYCDRYGVIRIEGQKPISSIYEVSVNESANISYPNQVIDDIESPYALFASLDGSWLLDRDYVLAPYTEGPQMGWWGSELSNNEGYFTEPYPSLTLSFFSKAISAVKVVGDGLRGEYPVDYTIKVYDANNQILSEQNITNNTNVTNITLIPENPTSATKIELTITRWSHPGRQTKILEFKDDVYSLEIDPTNYFKKNNPLKYTDMANYIEVIAQPLNNQGEKLEDIRVIARDEESIKEHGIIKFSFPSNPLIQTEEQALFIANTLLENFKMPRRNLELEWRGNPALLLGDTVSVVDNIEKNEYRVVKQELEYAGYLRAKLSGRRV